MSGPGPVALGILGAVASVILTGCGYLDDNPEDAQHGVCVDQATDNRLADGACGDDWDDDIDLPGTYIMWFPGTYGGSVPPVGARAVGGTRIHPAAGVARSRGVPAAGIAQGGGSIVQRGGLGVSGGKGGGS